MSKKVHVWVEEPVCRAGALTAAIVVEGQGLARRRVWYRIPAEHGGALTTGADPFVLALIFPAMRLRRDLHVHGEVAPALLRNLEEFQAAWRCWRPNRYGRVEIMADAEREQPACRNDRKAVMLFSGSVDSAFTALRHKAGQCGRRNLELQSGLLIHGIDVPLARREAFVRAAQKTRHMLESLGMRFIPMASNAGALGGAWRDCHGAVQASCLMLLQRGFAVGVIPGAEPYSALALPRGSNPVTDWMLSNGVFSIVHDGAGLTRTEKVRTIADWPEALRYLRVCKEGVPERPDANCGACERCLRTMLGFKALGMAVPGCFEKDVTEEQIAGLDGLDARGLAELAEILATAKSQRLSGSWVRALETCLRRNRMRGRLRRIMRWIDRHLAVPGAKPQGSAWARSGAADML